MWNHSRSTEHFDLGRRRALRAAAAAASYAMLGRAGRAVAQAPKETGLSFEGLLKGEPGFQPRSPMPLPFEEIPGFLSKAQLSSSYAAYRDAFDELLKAERGLGSAPRDAAHAREYGMLRGRQVRAANSVLLHEFYFRNLARMPVAPSRYILGNMDEHMGTLESWRADFAACARGADAWAVLAYDPYDDRWHDLPLGQADAGGMAGNNPLVVCDVSSAAWSTDYSDRDTYVARFLDHVDWGAVAARYRAVDRQ
jgi:superoxide dismutase